MKTRTRARALAAGFALLLALGACGTADSDGAAGSTSNTTDISEGVQPDPAAVALLPASYKDMGELSVAMDLHSPPTTFLADDSVTPIGLNPDVARLIAKKLGLDLKFVNTSFDTIIPGIEGGRYDFTVTSMSPTPERLEVLDMIDYFNGGLSVAVAAGNPLGLSTDNLCGKNIAVAKGSNAQLRHLPNISEWNCVSQGKPAINGITLPNIQEALTQLASKRVDGVIYDTPGLVWAQKQQPNAISVLTPPGRHAHGTHLRSRPQEGITTDPCPAGGRAVRPRQPRIREVARQLGSHRRGHFRRQAQLGGDNGATDCPRK